MNRKSLAAAILAALVGWAYPEAEAAEFTEVIDAFDVGDPFDLSLSIGYSRTLTMANVTRECYADQASPPVERWAYCPTIAGGDFLTTVDTLRWVHERHVLDISVMIGLWHDLNLKLGLPIVVSDTNQLDWAKGVNVDAGKAILRDDTTGEYLFHAPFKSPDRSGIDQLVAGLEWAIFNQDRDVTKPTWTLFAEGWFAVGKMIKPRGSYTDMDTGDKVEAGSGKSGVSPGLTELHVGTKLSHRFKWIDPYFGFEAWIPFAKREAPWPNMDEYPGQVNVNPPIRGTLTFGMEIIPWEVKAKDQKFYIDLRVMGSYITEGKSITPLFDALGTSTDRGLTLEDYTEFRDTYPAYQWTGVTDTEDYGSFSGTLTLGFITSKWFKISAGVSFAHDQEHFLNFTDECNASNFGLSDPTSGDTNCDWDPGDQADERSFNPDYRRGLDGVGNRFRIEESTIFTVNVLATAMF